MTGDRWGIDEGYEDAGGVWRTVSPDTRASLLRAMRIDAAAPPLARVRVIRAGAAVDLGAAGEIALEDGATLSVERHLPRDVPLGYHEFRARDEASVRLIVTPPACYLPPDLHTWGWATQLYATRSRSSWGFGDFADLHRLARWSRGLGAQILVVNPLHAPGPARPPDPSPYCPSSRRYRNPLYLRIEDVPGASDLGADLERLAAAGHALNDERRIDREAVGRLKMAALDAIWRRFRGDADLDRYAAAEADALTSFATFAVLAETHGCGWRDWPVEYRRPENRAVARFAEAHAERVRFHQWLQWLLDRQLARAAAEIALVHDFPIGVDPNGADAWRWQDELATEATVGAPPDRYNALGQDWGLPPFIPHRLQATAYEPFVRTIRAALRHAGGLRLDHVMGLFRLFWIPRGLTPAGGGYVRYPVDDLLGILALESHRARAFVVGEDLGTVERGVRERLTAERVLSYRVVWFESQPPARYPELSLAAVTTHDLPTIAGLWTGSDIDAQRRLGYQVNNDGFTAMRRRVAAMTGVAERADVREVIERTYRALGEAPSVVVTATLDDALAVEQRPNMPGTTTQWPNWSLALPEPLEEIETSPLAAAIADALGRGRRSP